MADQSVNSPHSNQKNSASDEENTDSAKVQSQRLEELLLDQDDSDPIDALIGREVMPVDYERKASSWFILLVLLILLMVIGLLGAAYMLNRQSEQSPPQFTVADVEVRQPIPARPLLPQMQQSPQGAVEKTDIDVVLATDNSLPEVEAIEPVIPLPAAEQKNLYTLVVGPFINSQSLGSAEQILAGLGMQTEQQPGRGMVQMFRLLEGVYPPEEAKKRLKDLNQKTNSAFLLPQQEHKALYAGSFFDKERALLFQLQLQQQQVNVTLAQVEVAMDGTSLVALKTDKETAQQLADLIRERGLAVHVSLDK